MYQILKLFLVPAFLATTTLSSYAADKRCYEPSPNLEKSENEYYNLEDTIALNGNDKRALTAFLKNLKGKWVGESQHTECRGPDRAPRKSVNRAVVKAKINVASTTKLDVVAEKKLKQKRVTRSDKFALPNLANTYHLTFNNDVLIFSEKYRRSNTLNVVAEEPKASSNTVTIVDRNSNPNATPPPTKPVKKLSSRLVETIYEVKRNGSALFILRSFYTNGIYVGEEQWKLKRN